MGRECLQCVMGFHHMWLRIWESRAAHCLVYHTQTNPDSWEIGRHNQSSSNFYLLGISVCDKQDQPAVWGEHTHRHTVILTHTQKRHIYTDKLIHILEHYMHTHNSQTSHQQHLLPVKCGISCPADTYSRRTHTLFTPISLNKCAEQAPGCIQ